MIEHIWTVVCSRSVVDERSKNVSIQNVIEQVTTTGEPILGQVISMQLEVVSFWTRTEPGVPITGRMRIEFHAPSGKVLGSFEYPLDLTKYERFRSQVRLAGIPAEEAGRHYFYVALKEESESEWQRVAAVPLTIAFKPPEEEESAESKPDTDE